MALSLESGKTIRAVFFGFQNPHLVEVLRRLSGHDSLEYVASIDERQVLSSDHVHEHLNFWDILWGRYPGEPQNLLPLSDSLIRAMSRCETIVLRMMDRMDPVHPKTFDFRKKLYLKHLQFWNDFLETRKISHIFFANIPHEICDYIAYELCKLKKIETHMFCQSAVSGYTFLFSDYETGAVELGECFKQMLSDYEVSGRVPPVSEHMTRLIDEKLNKASEDSAPFYMKQAFEIFRNSHSYFHLFRRALSFFSGNRMGAAPRGEQSRVGELLSRYLHRRMMIKDDLFLRREYEKLATSPDYSLKFIFLPLHYQPECTTSPMGGSFVEQDLIIRMLASVVPDDVWIYVKEHPVQRSYCRTLDWYRDLAKLPRVRFISRSTPSLRLIKSSLAVATVTGTAGWEAILNGRPALMFGSFFYQYAPNVFSIRDIADCRHAIDSILKVETSDPGLMKVFLAAVESVAVRGYSDNCYKDDALIPPEQNSTNLLSALRDRLGFRNLSVEN